MFHTMVDKKEVIDSNAFVSDLDFHLNSSSLDFDFPDLQRENRTMSFTGTQQKCKACEKTVYPVELLSADGVSYHKSCFKCSHCKGTLKVSSNFMDLFPILVHVVSNISGYASP